jgi:hypothetical protein
MFHSGVRTLLVSYFRWWNSVHSGATMSLQQMFFSYPSEYNIDNLFFIDNYCHFFPLYLSLIALKNIYVIKLIKFINPIKLITCVSNFVFSLRTLLISPKYYLYIL